MKNILKLTLLVSLMATAHLGFAADTVLQNTAQKAGFTRCLETVKSLEDFFIDGNNYGHRSVWAAKNTASQVFSSTIEITFSDGSQLVDLTVAPTADGQCSYSYTRTLVLKDNCVSVSRQDWLQKAEYKGMVNKNIMRFDNGAADTMLLDVPGGQCLMQRKEVGLATNPQKR